MTVNPYADFQAEWARKNKPPETKLPFVIRAGIPLLVWSAAGLTFATYQWPDDLPQFAHNLAAGLVWLYMFTVVVMTFLLVMALIPLAVAKRAFRDALRDQTADAPRHYEAMKSQVADCLMPHEFSAFRTLRLGVLVGLFFAGGAIFCGLLAFMTRLAAMFMFWLDRDLTRTGMAEVITPERIAWVEGRVATLSRHISAEDLTETIERMKP